MTQPEPLSIDEVTISQYSGTYNVSCFDSEDGSILLDGITGGHDYHAYTYYWKDLSGSGTPDSTSRDQANLGVGFYTVTVSDTFNCAVADTFELAAPDEIVITPEVSASIAGGYNLNCFGETSGYIKLQVSGGDTTGYQYRWDHSPLTTNELFNLPAGDYRVTVTDGLGCEKRDTITLTQPLLLRVDSAGISDYNGFGISCPGSSDGSIFIRPAGGTPDFTFNWTLDGIPVLPDTAFMTNLQSGAYSLTLTDANNCQTSWQGNLTEPSVMELTIETDNMNCTGTVPGNARAIVSGGIAPYDYSWDNGAVTATITGLDTGLYVLTVHDLNLCIITDTAVIEQNTGVEIEIQVMDSISCNGGSDGVLRAEVTGGISPYTYLWGDGRDTQSVGGISEGSYSVDVTDNQGCKGTQSLILDDPDPLKAAFTVTDALCYGSDDGSVLLGAEGGTGAFRYQWNTDPVNGNEVENLTAGNYHLRVEDTENCRTDTTVVIGQPEKLTVTLDGRYTVYPFCPDWQNGALAVAVSGGVRDYEYIWTDYPGDRDSILSDIKEDSYELRIIDNHNCVMDTVFMLTAQNSTCLGIPTAFTPNYDDANDTWDISYINEDGREASFYEVYPNGIIQIYDRLGNLVYRCTGGCPEEWNGEDLKGRDLPVDSYYYIIELNSGGNQSPLTGTVTIIR